jgi:hypothetical protein
MADNTSSGTGVTPPTGSPETGTTSNGAMPAKPTTTLEEALARIAELEHSHKNATEERDRHRKKLTSYEEAERKAQESALSEVDKANKAREQAEAQIQQYKKQLVDARVELAAKAKGIINPTIAAAAIRDQLEYGDDGMPSNLEKALDELIKGNPYLIAQPASPAQTHLTPAIPAMNPGRTSIQPPAAPQQLPRRLMGSGLLTGNK